jgi:hypothetical protein
MDEINEENRPKFVPFRHSLLSFWRNMMLTTTKSAKISRICVICVLFLGGYKKCKHIVIACGQIHAELNLW